MRKRKAPHKGVAQAEPEMVRASISFPADRTPESALILDAERRR